MRFVIILSMLLLLKNEQTFAQLYWNGTGSWTSANAWSNVSGGPYNQTWTTNTAVFDVATNTITGATIICNGITATGDVTFTPTGTFGTGGTVITIDVANGKTFDFGGQAISVAAGTGFVKSNTGVIAITGSTYNGGFTLNGGTLVIRGVNAIGTGVFTINGGTTICSNANRDLSGKPSSILVGGDFTIGASTGLASNTATLKFDAPISLGTGTTRKITLNNFATHTLNGVISGVGSNLILDATNGATALSLGGANTYNGLTTISGGVLQLNKTGGGTLPATNDVLINNAGPFFGQLQVSSNQILNNLTLESGCNLIVDNGVVLTINGTFNHNGGNIILNGTGSISYGAGATLSYGGSVAQITGTAPAEWPTLNGPASLIINNTNGVTLNATGGRAIGGALTLTNGILKTTTLLTMNAGSNVAAVSNTSFVDSAMRKIGNTDFTFPVGRAGIGYVPIQIVTFGSGAVTDEFTAAYSRSSAEALGSITVPAQVGLNHVSRVDYWKLDHIGTVTADVILYWTAGSSSNGSASYIDILSELAIARFNGTQWDSYAIPAIVTPLSTVTAGSIKWQLASSFGSFSLASSTISNPLPINLNYLNGIKQGNNNILNWKVTCTNNPNATMSVQHSTDGRNYNSITTIFADALRCLQPFDFTDNNPQAGLNYYRLKMVDANGKITYSAPIAILNKETGVDIVSLSPTLVNTKTELNVTAAQKTIMTVVITDVAGKQVQKMLYNLIAGSNKFTVNAAGLSAGTYQITGYTADGKSRTIRFVKQ